MLRKASGLFFILISATSSFVFGQQTLELQHQWEVDPPLGNIWGPTTSTRTILFDIELLKSRFTKDRLQVAQSIGLEYDNPKFQQRERALELLITGLNSGEENLLVKRAMVAATLSLGDGSHANVLWSLAKSDAALLPAVERKLVDWKSPIALTEWRQRLGDPKAKPTELATALEGLAVIGNADDRLALQAVILASHTSVANKYLAACALGGLVTKGLNEFAKQVMESDLDQRYLIASELIKFHSGEQTAAQMRHILTEGPASAQLVAYRSMSQGFPEVAREFAKPMTSHSDPGLRTLALQFLQQYSDVEGLEIQGALLKDRNPGVRSLVAKHLLEKANQGHRARVDECVVSHLNAAEWTGIEKAIVVAVGLEDRRHCKAFLRLLEHPRPEVNLIAGWALKEIGDEPENLAGMLGLAERMTAELNSTTNISSISLTDRIWLSYLHEAFGKNHYEPASQMLMKYIPKTGHQFGTITRASAIWSLGKLNTGKDNKVLREKLQERIADLAPVNPEDYLVRFASNLALGEMAHPESREVIVRYHEQLPSPLAYAADWALSQIDKASAVKPLE